MSDLRAKLEISLHGPGANIEAAVKAAQSTKKILRSIAANMGVPDGTLDWEIVSVQFKCDGCGLTRPDRPAAGEGWTYRDGDDLCPQCSEGSA